MVGQRPIADLMKYMADTSCKFQRCCACSAELAKDFMPPFAAGVDLDPVPRLALWLSGASSLRSGGHGACGFMQQLRDQHKVSRVWIPCDLLLLSHQKVRLSRMASSALVRILKGNNVREEALIVQSLQALMTSNPQPSTNQVGAAKEEAQGRAILGAGHRSSLRRRGAVHNGTERLWGNESARVQHKIWGNECASRSPAVVDWHVCPHDTLCCT